MSINHRLEELAFNTQSKMFFSSLYLAVMQFIKTMFFCGYIKLPGNAFLRNGCIYGKVDIIVSHFS